MAHIHSLTDSDLHFKIDPITRKIINESEKNQLVQHDHNSEYLSFEIPRYIEGHDMSLCDKVEIHFINLSANKRDSNPGIHKVKDLQLNPVDDGVVIFGWEIDDGATYHIGLLFFAIHFTCTGDDGDVYRWSTLLYDNPGLFVGESLFNAEEILKRYADPLEAWKKEILSECDEKINALSEEIANLQTSGLTTAQVNALDGMFQKCAFTGDVSAEYEAFKTAFGITESSGEDTGGDSGETEVTLTSISATYTGGDVTVGTALTDLTGITVTATYSDGSTANVTDYTLSGEIVEGENTITVSYGGKTTTFTVTGVAESGGEETGVSNETTWTDGVAYTFEPIADEYPDKATGEITAYSGWGRSPYLYCAGASTLRAVVKYKTSMFNGTNDNAFYDADKNYVAPIDTDGTTATNDFTFKALNNAEVGTYHDITIPENAAYFVVSAKYELYTGSASNTNSEPYIEYVPYE